jgi:hypothetical protein
VEVRPEGTRRIYSVDPRGLAEVRAYFEQFWAGALSAYAEHVQKATPTEEEQ